MVKIHPHEGAGTIRFGMTRDEVSVAVGLTPVRARRNKYATADYDLFERLGLFVYYDTNDTCNAIEFTRDANVTYEGYALFAHPAAEARSWAKARDPNLERADGFISIALGLSMYAPFICEAGLTEEDKGEEPAESFMAFRRGYWEEARTRLLL